MTDRNASYRQDFLDALAILAKVFDRVVELGGSRPVIVGGASVEFYTAGSIETGDVDIVTSADDAFARAMSEAGFRRPKEPGASSRGWIHDGLAMAVEVVGSTLLDGTADRGRVRVVKLGSGTLAMLGLEDLIADRMGQYAADPAHGSDMLDQAKALLSLGGRTDRDYLDSRIRAETLGTCTLETLDRWTGS